MICCLVAESSDMVFLSGASAGPKTGGPGSRADTSSGAPAPEPSSPRVSALEEGLGRGDVSGHLPL